jgi:hypothetical protein
MLYAQLARDSGWNAYKTVFNIYDKLPDECRPKTQKEKDNMWMVTFSKVVPESRANCAYSINPMPAS